MSDELHVPDQIGFYVLGLRVSRTDPALTLEALVPGGDDTRWVELARIRYDELHDGFVFGIGDIEMYAADDEEGA